MRVDPERLFGLSGRERAQVQRSLQEANRQIDRVVDDCVAGKIPLSEAVAQGVALKMSKDSMAGEAVLATSPSSAEVTPYLLRRAQETVLRHYPLEDGTES